MPHKCLCWILSLSIVITGGTPLSLYAQQSDLPVPQPVTETAGEASSPLDLQPPVIVMQEQQTGSAGEDQMFTADVTDDLEVLLVELFYRRAGESGYISLPMQPAADSSFYSASVSTSVTDSRSIEYYIQAEDRAGNKSIKGFIFNPLVRTLQSDATTVASAGSEQGGFKRPWLWGILGLVAVAVIAGAANSGGSDDPAPTTGDPITIDVTPLP